MKKVLLFANISLTVAVLSVSAIGLILAKHVLIQGQASSENNSYPAVPRPSYVAGNMGNKGTLLPDSEGAVYLGVPFWFDMTTLNQCKPVSQMNFFDQAFGGWEDKVYFDGDMGINNLKWVITQGWLEKQPADPVLHGVLNVETAVFGTSERLGTGVLEIGIEPDSDVSILLWTYRRTNGYRLKISRGEITLERDISQKRSGSFTEDSPSNLRIPLNCNRVLAHSKHLITIVRYHPYENDGNISRFQILIDGRELLSSIEDHELDNGELWLERGRFNRISFTGLTDRSKASPYD